MRQWWTFQVHHAAKRAIKILVALNTVNLLFRGFLGTGIARLDSYNTELF